MESLQQSIRNIFQPLIIVDGVEYGNYPSQKWDENPSQVDRVEEAEIIEETPGQQTKAVLRIERRIYQALADELCDRIDGRDYISSEVIEVEDDCKTYQLFISAAIYYRQVTAPDGRWDQVVDVVPTWCELHSFEGEDMKERFNDFNFEKLKKYIL